MRSTVEGSAAALKAARAALARGAWEEARQGFQAVLDREELAEALEGLGNAAYRLDDVPAIFECHERAYRLYRERGDPRAAARVALSLATEYADFQGDLAASGGWTQRARRLLEGQATSPEHGWLFFMEGYLAIWSQDLALAITRAEETAAVGQALNLLDLEMLALALEGVALVGKGTVGEGLRKMDEAATAAVAGELSDLTAVSIICCATLYACNWVADYERASHLAHRVKAYSQRQGLDPLFTLCRLNHAPVHLWKGAWIDAEEDLAAAIRALESTRPPYFMEGVARLAELRRRQGRLEETRTLLARAEPHPLSLLVRAAFELDAGDPLAAGDLVERFLRHVTPEDWASRVFARGVHLRAELARGRIEDAARISSDMEALAEVVRTLPLLASSRLAAGLVAFASGNGERARQCFEDALDLYQRAAAPYEAAGTRVHLARCLVSEGRHRSAVAELRLAVEAFQKLGAEPERLSAERLLQEAQAADEQGAVPEARADGLTAREIEVLRLLAAGRSNQEIAAALVLSLRTVERHISNIYVKLDISGKTARVAAAAYAMTQEIGQAVR